MIWKARHNPSNIKPRIRTASPMASRLFLGGLPLLHRRHDLGVAQVVSLVEQRIEPSAFERVEDARSAGGR